MHLDLLERLRNLVLHLRVPNCHLLQLVRQLRLSVLQRVASPDRCLLHRLELDANIFD